MTSGRRSRQQRAAGLRTSALPPADADGYHVKHEFTFNGNARSNRRAARHTFRSLRKPGAGIANGFKQRRGHVDPRRDEASLGHSTQQHVWRRRASNRMHRKMRRATRQAQR